MAKKLKPKSELNPKATALSLAAASGILYLACAAFFAIAPKTALDLFKDMFHGIDITQIAVLSISAVSVLSGLIQILVTALIGGWLFATSYNYLAKKLK